jgi:aminoacrylate hydrolase
MRCPTLVIVGESDFCMPPHRSEQMAEGIPGAELVKLPGGHFLFLEHPAAFPSPRRGVHRAAWG